MRKLEQSELEMLNKMIEERKSKISELINSEYLSTPERVRPMNATPRLKLKLQTVVNF